MSNYSLNMTTCRKRRASLKVIGKIALIVVCTGVILAFGFWLLMMSNMGPAYLSNVCNGCLDIWIRMTLLMVGMGLWVVTGVWYLWHVCHWGYDWIKRYS